ncbi:hypothetical protein CYMTET_14884 [Cymbomonas tetramitiformis]|uniref:Uncharacterized protein n=1 Tax=Cymbomonas tetramitiformis TaxID=36881 RepID=A0AAE0L9X1_9CHLO|nr:hypothetical protein CYMTET_14884 [Cymbomonas tetramitiformis]
MESTIENVGRTCVQQPLPQNAQDKSKSRASTTTVVGSHNLPHTPVWAFTTGETCAVRIRQVKMGQSGPATPETIAGAYMYCLKCSQQVDASGVNSRTTLLLVNSVLRGSKRNVRICTNSKTHFPLVDALRTFVPLRVSSIVTSDLLDSAGCATKYLASAEVLPPRRLVDSPNERAFGLTFKECESPYGQ